jgi:hypothetical protein
MLKHDYGLVVNQHGKRRNEAHDLKLDIQRNELKIHETTGMDIPLLLTRILIS